MENNEKTETTAAAHPAAAEKNSGAEKAVGKFRDVRSLHEAYNALQAEFTQFPHLVLRDRTTRPVDIWGSLGQDSFEGVYFGLLRQALDAASEEEKEEILLAAELSRQLLEGQEVVLP